MMTIRQSTSDCSTYVPANYTLTPPAPETQVSISHTIVSLPHVSESEQFYEIHLYYHRLWKDPRVHFTFPDSQSVVTVPANDHHCFWIPEIIFNGADILSGTPVNDEIVPQNLRYQKDEMIVFAAKYILKVACRMKMSMYPMGSHNCFLIILTPMASGHYITWNSDQLFTDVKMSSGEFALQAVHRLTETRCMYKDDAHPCLILHFVFKRNLAISLITIYFPSVIIVMVSFVSFWIDNQNVPGRVTLVVTSLLALLTQMLSVRESLPAMSLVTAMDIWFFICVSTVACALFEFAVVHRLSHVSHSAKANTPNLSQPVSKWRRRMRRLDDVCRFVFPVVFFGITAIYFGVCQSLTSQ
ncbi:Gamma-aminobutyric acid receptor subunit delta [Halotydeus destructor]|nr:Gamma-aminobutyric acid receptor subunit delta [Halotydeus destructor]